MEEEDTVGPWAAVCLWEVAWVAAGVREAAAWEAWPLEPEEVCSQVGSSDQQWQETVVTPTSRITTVMMIWVEEIWAVVMTWATWAATSKATQPYPNSLTIFLTCLDTKVALPML